MKRVLPNLEIECTAWEESIESKEKGGPKGTLSCWLLLLTSVDFLPASQHRIKRAKHWRQCLILVPPSKVSWLIIYRVNCTHALSLFPYQLRVSCTCFQAIPSASPLTRAYLRVADAQTTTSQSHIRREEWEELLVVPRWGCTKGRGLLRKMHGLSSISSAMENETGGRCLKELVSLDAERAAD
ncbi:hypothetical protein MUK42_21419 [Musa troglodytarum]|uniref:Uncharacterized protein n=1 Tax=Musa troglodytarum TaxID=320322 RepID=A0A9E7K6C5_9LILI|nr:hypothetical protein MUK42_21419 [Musa troglodytarum]